MAYRRRLTQDVTIYDPSRAFNGYTFFAPTFQSDAWLIDMRGNICHHWDMKLPPASHGKLLPNGNVMWQCKGPESLKDFVGSGSVIREVDWDGNEVWRYEEPGLNHDFLVLDNGNLVVNVYVPIPDALARRIKGGIPGTELRGRIWTCLIKEITRKGETVWEWNIAEHLDPEHDVLCPLCHRHVWGFCNSLDRLPDGKILFTLRLLNDVGIFDPRTGEIVWRFGRDKELGHPHSCSYLENGHILLFDNGLHRVSSNPDLQIADIAASRVIEIDPDTNRIVWQYMDPLAPNFFSAICSAAERLPNGNTLICEATRGRFFEVTRENDIVWEYFSPFLVNRPNYWGWTLSATVWAAHRYAPDYPGLRGRDLDPEKFEWLLQRRTARSMEEEAVLKRLKSLGY